MSFTAFLKKFDLYRVTPSDIAQPTLTGSIISLTALIFISYLFVSEVATFLSVDVKSDLFVDSNYSGHDGLARLRINLNITLPAVPCGVISVDVQDVLGTHVVDVHGDLKKMRLSASGVPVLDVLGRPLNPEVDSITSANQQIGEGCNIYGYMLVKKVPGNFHVSAHAHANLLAVYFPQGFHKMNVSHVIHQLSFGEIIEDASNLRAALNPLNGISAIHTPPEKVESSSSSTTKHSGHGHGHDHDHNSDNNEDSGTSISYEYYIKIVPTTLERLNGRVTHTYQFTANSNQIQGHYQLPALYFRYDLSPITVKFTQSREAMSHFLVQVCAIIGGVFTVLGLVSTFIGASIQQIKKARINKLG